MKSLFSFLFISLITMSVSFSQSSDRIREEANPEYKYVPDNSEYAQLWHKQVAARKSGDMKAYNSAIAEIKQKYPDKFQGTDVTNSGALRVVNFNQAPFVPDWISGADLTVYTGVVGGTSSGNPSPFNRNVRIQADSNGNQYAAFLTGAKDTIVVYKSLNGGNTWNRLFGVLGSGVGYIHSFDMFVTDSANTFRLGFAISIETDGGSDYNGDMYWLSVTDAGTTIGVTLLPKPVGRGLISPALVSDGFKFTAVSTYWYMTYQNCDTTTGVTNLALLAMSTNWGRTWLVDTARSTFNDYDLDVDYDYNADSVYVNLTNNLTLTNENLRLRYVALSDIGTGVSFKQFNTAGSSDPERSGTLCVNRQTNEIVVMYTRVTGGNSNIYMSYSPLGYGNGWTVDVPVFDYANNVDRAMITCQEQQSAYRMCCVSSGAVDTILYTSTFTMPSFGGSTIVNSFVTSSGLAPAVIGFKSGAGFGGGVLFSGQGTNMYYDGSATFVGVEPISSTIPNAFSLGQNYPNPFNPATVIKFAIPVSGFVSLKVFDILGKEVSVLVNGEMKAGEYKADFDASKLPSGVYFYKLTSNKGFSSTKKMILVK
jgi:hypothetical protein